jgi:hypothetical protein
MEMNKLSPVGITAIILWACLILAGYKMHEGGMGIFRQRANISSFDTVKYGIITCNFNFDSGEIVIYSDGRVAYPGMGKEEHVQLNSRQLSDVVDLINKFGYLSLSEKIKNTPKYIDKLTHTGQRFTSVTIKGREYKIQHYNGFLEWRNFDPDRKSDKVDPRLFTQVQDFEDGLKDIIQQSTPIQEFELEWEQRLTNCTW